MPTSQIKGTTMADGLVTIGAAVVAASGVLIVAYANSFVAEQFRRHLDSTAYAAALAGELESHASAFPILRAGFLGMLALVDEKKPLPLHSFPTPTDPIFDSAPGKVGMLGKEFAGEVAYAYEQLRAFRVAMSVLTEHHTTMDPETLKKRLAWLHNMIADNEQRMASLIHGLKAYSDVRFRDTLRITHLLRKVAHRVDTLN
jgi:hypothetical protein